MTKTDIHTNHLRAAAKRSGVKLAELLHRAADEIDGLRKHAKAAESAHYECKDLLNGIARELDIAVDSPYDLDAAIPEYAVKVTAMKLAVAAARDEHRARTAYRAADQAYHEADVETVSRSRAAKSDALKALLTAEYRTKMALADAALSYDVVAG